MEQFVRDLIQQLAHIFNGTRTLNPLTEVRRISEIHPVYADIHSPMMARLHITVNPAFDACEKFKAKCEPVAFFPGSHIDGASYQVTYRAYPIYLVAPWEALDIPDSLQSMRGLILFNRVIGPDRIFGSHFDNEMGQWGVSLIKDEIALKNLPYQEHDRGLIQAMGKNWRDLSWLKSLLEREKVFYALKQ